MNFGAKLLGGKAKARAADTTAAPQQPEQQPREEHAEERAVGPPRRIRDSCILKTLPLTVGDLAVWETRLVLATSKGAIYIYAPLGTSEPIT